ITIHCEVDTQVTLMFWYRQLPGQSLILIATANQGAEATYESGFTREKFPISRRTLMFSTLTVSNLSLEDTSSYFCSTRDTAPSTDQRSEQEPQLAPSHPASSLVNSRPQSRQVGGEDHSLSCSLCACWRSGSCFPSIQSRRLLVTLISYRSIRPMASSLAMPQHDICTPDQCKIPEVQRPATLMSSL
uniref:Ig-like domain-containing protein n=1 Tax=Canis lupus familiaris TaxID=9615 RepID=A0A8C0Q701_CANLF